MKYQVKILSLLMVFILLLLTVSCGGEKNEETNQSTSQKVYNTSFKQATSAKPITTTATETTETETAVATLPTTVKRTGKRPVYKQDKPMRKITSAQLFSQMGSGITLGDSFTATGLSEGASIDNYETAFNNPKVSAELINAYAKAGFSAVRIPVSFAEHIDEAGNVDKEWLNRIAEVADMVLDNDMYCIIASQSEQSWLSTANGTFVKTKNKFSNMWTSVATKFKKYDDRLLFEGTSDVIKAVNDMSAPSDTDIENMNKLNQAFVDSIRTSGGYNAVRHLIISTYGSFVDSASLNGFQKPNDSAKNRLAVKVNFYIPSSFCLDESQKNTWGTAEEKQYLESVFAMINTAFEKLSLPVIIGEFGAVDKGNLSARAAYASYVISTAYNYYIVCFWNDNGNNMKVFDRENYQNVQEKIVKSIIGSAG